ncbi:Superoxide dismutase [Dipsacomyces acuminosporus]|nr:Superoxide dismutase [Dipsacomyces acuminosporus]
MAIAFQNRLDRNGLDVSVHARGLIPDMAYPYHIHVGPVPKDGNCTATLGHFDPAHVNTDPKTYHCDPKAMETTCELGDLAGRHGNITASAGGTFGAYYSDPLLALDGPNSIIGRSVVIHAPNNTRLACADIVPVV